MGRGAIDEDERRRVYDEWWQRGGYLFAKAFPDQMTNLQANDTAREYVEAKIREMVQDPEIANQLIPNDHPIGTKRIVTDDGLPATGSLTTTWSKVSGPGDVVFANANAASTAATFAEAGVYVLRLTANDSELSSSDEVTITVEAANLAPVVNAGADQTVTLPNTASLSGSVTDDGKPVGATVTSTWSKVSGPGTVTFANAAAPSTTATFSIEGTYVLRLTADDTDYITSDTITIIVNPIPPNQVPTVNAGADQVINPPATTAALSGTVTDDGLPPNVSLTYQWTKVSGPGNVTFSNPTSLTTNVTFSEAGAYILRLSANDSELTGSDDVRVTLNGINKAPTVNAGVDQTVAHPATVNLTGTANDDGLPVDSVLSFTWSKLSGPGTVTFGNAAAAKEVVKKLTEELAANPPRP